ncbi:UNVERIFIED_CONTAM: hypothetical protein RF653_06015 [Kocuria sp. CPCC 205316]|uniref:hypothetical protein n=1 Tax=Kocuria TaxID=57493 RepID=UPI0036D85560
MPTLHATRSAAARAVAVTAVLLTLTGCSFADRQPEPEQTAAQAPVSSAASTGPAGEASAGTVDEACARVLDTVRTAPDQLRQDPLGLLVEIDEIARTAPAELSGELTDLRDAVEGFRQGDESLISVVRKARDLQERCSA